MIDRSKPLFLARESYRRRRLIDASRLLPLIGGVLFLLPLVWTEPDAGSLARRGLFLFVIWGGLVAASAYLAHLLAKIPDERAPTPHKDPREDSDVL